MSQLPQANKDLGQHFLRDKTVIKAIAEDFASECDVIIEVGPGPAVLTPSLAAVEKDFYVIEKDPRFAESLKEHVKKERIFIADALDFDWDIFLDENNLRDKKIWLVSNLPYNVGTILFTQFLQINEIKFMSLMFQKEVGEKTYLRNIKNEMNGLLFLSQNYFDSKLLKKVSPGCFTPPPKVDSVVVSYERRDNPNIPVDQFKKINSFLRHIFQFKRKQLGGVLTKIYPKDKVMSALNESSVSPQIRAEGLSIEQMLQIFSYLKSKD